MNANDLKDPFFNSFIEDYPEFKSWYIKKSLEGDFSFFHYCGSKIDGFIKLKEEKSSETNYFKNSLLKISSFKLDCTAKKLANPLLDSIHLFAENNGYQTIYATCFEKHKLLINKLLKFGYVIVDNTVEEKTLIKKIGQDDE
jgi:hypothetical protein